MASYLPILFFLSAGSFSFAGAFFDWDFFMESRRAAFFVRIFGRKTARIIYGALGLGIIGLGVAMGLGYLPMGITR